MIRLLQQNNKATRILFGVIIGAAIVSMVIYLVPGLMDNSGSNNASLYATVHEPGLWGRLFGESIPIKSEKVAELAQRQLQQQKIPDALMSYFLPQMMDRSGQILVQRAMLKQAADDMHLQVSDEDLRRELRTGPFAQ